MKSSAATTKKLESGHQIRLLTEEDFEQAEDIWSLSFTDWPRNSAREDLDRVYGAFKEKRLDAVVGVVDFEMRLGKKLVPCGGIAAVATAPGQRYQRLINALLKECLLDLHNKRVALSCLWPFQHYFYERLGWASTHNAYGIEVDLSYLKRVAREGDARNWRMLPLDDWDDILPIHDRWMRNWNLNLRRLPDLFDRIVHSRSYRWQLFIHNDGYMLWNLGASSNRVLNVREFGYVTEAAYLDGLALFAQMDAQYDRVIWVDGDAERLFKLGVPHPNGSIELKPGMMTRVVHLDAFEKALPKPLGKLAVYDPLGVTSGETAGVISPGELVQLVSGYWSTPDPRFPTELHAIVGDQKALCREMF